jgi:transposase
MINFIKMKEITMQVVNPRCAGIDVGSRFHVVAVDQFPTHVKEFGVYTQDHEEMVLYLKDHGITSIAMESTGPYWQTLFDSLQQAGFDVELINGNQTKNVKGKKTDTIDCMWIQKLHSLGLLSGSFLPSESIVPLRTYYSHRQHLVNQCSKYINKMQKTLALMNVRLDVVLNDIMGLSGRSIISAILSGERNPEVLASLANYRVKKSKEEIARALKGNWRADLMFELQSSLSLYDTYCKEIENCDHQLEESIKAILKKGELELNSGCDLSVKSNKQRNKHSPKFDIENLSTKYYGVNLMQIPNVGQNTVLCLLTQIGNDIFKFPTSKHFCSWLRLAPNNKITGGQIVSSRTPKGKNKLSLALRQAANSIGNQSKGELAQFFKKISHRKGRAAAITATARKLAVILYNMITKREDFKPIIFKPSEKVIGRIIQNIQRKLDQLDLTKEQMEFLFKKQSPSMG